MRRTNIEVLMIKLTETSRKIIKAIYRGVGIVGIALSLGGCWLSFVYEEPKMYGPGPDYREDFRIQGKVVNKKTGAPITGITVYIQYLNYQTTTSYNGQFYFWLPKQHDTYTLIFTDIDGSANGGNFKQYTRVLTNEEAHGEDPLLIELEEVE